MVTRLEIINHMLFTIGEQVQNTLETMHPSVTQAQAILTSVDKDFQGRGWWFNKEYEITLALNELGQIIVPESAMSVEVVACSAAPLANRNQYAVRGNKIYDAVNHTFTIAGPLVCNIVIQLDIEDLPHSAGTYVKHMAAEAMHTDDDGDTKGKGEKLAERVMLAWHNLKAEELKVANINALNSPHAAQLRYRMTQAMAPSNPRLLGGR